ncbi:hypothetical protein AJ80_05199, partial [Polytolypa hystricis UAMH7299]
MTNADVSSIISAILSAFGSGADLFRQMQKKKKLQERSEKPKTTTTSTTQRQHSQRKRKRKKQPNNGSKNNQEDIDNQQLCKSLHKGPADIRKEYEKSVQRLGERFRKGDELAQGSLAHTLLVLNAGLMKLICSCLANEGSTSGKLAASATSRRSLLTLSETATIDAIGALDDLRQRLLIASVPTAAPIAAVSMPRRKSTGSRGRSVSRTRDMSVERGIGRSLSLVKGRDKGTKGKGEQQQQQQQQRPVSKNQSNTHPAVRHMWVRSKKGSSISLATTVVGSSYTPPPKKASNAGVKQCDLPHNQGHPAFHQPQRLSNGQIDFRQFSHGPAPPPTQPALSGVGGIRRTTVVGRAMRASNISQLSPLVPLSSQSIQIPPRRLQKSQVQAQQHNLRQHAETMSISSGSTKLGEIPPHRWMPGYNTSPPTGLRQDGGNAYNTGPGSAPVADMGYQAGRSSRGALKTTGLRMSFLKRLGKASGSEDGSETLSTSSTTMGK